MPLDDSRDDTVLDSIAFTAVDDLLVLCHTSASPSDVEWDTWIARERRKEHRGILISTEGGAPNSSQRARIAAMAGKNPGLRPPVALLTDSAVIRSVMTAFAWLLGKEQPMKAFPPAAIAEAIKWLGVGVRPARVEAALSRLQSALASSSGQKAVH